MSRKLFAIVLGCALLAPVIASAHPTECTPGFWKNWMDEYPKGVLATPYCLNGIPQDLPRCGMPGYDYCCAANWALYLEAEDVTVDPLTCGQLADFLNTGGACDDVNMDNDPDCRRHDAAEFLNSCHVIEWTDYNPCFERED
jgi:hypothetical protein